ncbi:MAG: MFS transporter [Proteobacteria bacterium]|nr:MFS transporter [Pseudomonadota bacterium]
MSQPATASTRALEAFRAPHYGKVWSSNLLQTLSGQIHVFTLMWLVTDLTTSRTVLGLVSAISGATVAVSSPFAGVAVDRFSKRNLLILGRLGTLLVVLCMMALVAADRIELWHIFAGAGFAGLLSAISQPATQTFVFDVVGKDRAQPAVALNSAGIGLGQMGGPALAGFLIATGGSVGSWLTAAAGLALGTLLLLRVPLSGRAPTRGRAPWLELRDGFAYVVRHPPVLLALLACAMAFFNGALFAMRPVFARYVLEVGSQGMGTMAAAAGLGTLLGAAAAAFLPTFRRPGIAIALSMLGFSTCIFLYAFAFSYPYILGVEFASGLFAQLWQVATFSGLQMAVPEELRGRVMGILFTVVQLAQIGGLFVGGLADRVGDQLAMGIFGAIPMLFLIGLLAFGHRQLGRLGAETA